MTILWLLTIILWLFYDYWWLFYDYWRLFYDYWLLLMIVLWLLIIIDDYFMIILWLLIINDDYFIIIDDYFMVIHDILWCSTKCYFIILLQVNECTLTVNLFLLTIKIIFHSRFFCFFSLGWKFPLTFIFWACAVKNTWAFSGKILCSKWRKKVHKHKSTFLSFRDECFFLSQSEATNS